MNNCWNASDAKKCIFKSKILFSEINEHWTSPSTGVKIFNRDFRITIRGNRVNFSRLIRCIEIMRVIVWFYELLMLLLQRRNTWMEPCSCRKECWKYTIQWKFFSRKLIAWTLSIYILIISIYVNFSEAKNRNTYKNTYFALKIYLIIISIPVNNYFKHTFYSKVIRRHISSKLFCIRNNYWKWELADAV